MQNQLVRSKQFHSSLMLKELLLFLNCRKAQNFMGQDKEKLYWGRFFPTCELSMGFVPCSQRQRCSGFSGQLNPLSCCSPALVSVWMWVTEGKRCNHFQGLSLACRMLWSSRNCKMAQNISLSFCLSLLEALVQILSQASKIHLFFCFFFFSGVRLPECHNTPWFAADMLLSPLVCSSAVIHELCPCHLSTSCTLLITSTSVNLYRKSSIFASFPWDLTRAQAESCPVSCL